MARHIQIANLKPLSMLSGYCFKNKSQLWRSIYNSTQENEYYCRNILRVLRSSNKRLLLMGVMIAYMNLLAINPKL